MKFSFSALLQNNSTLRLTLQVYNCTSHRAFVRITNWTMDWSVDWWTRNVDRFDWLTRILNNWRILVFHVCNHWFIIISCIVMSRHFSTPGDSQTSIVTACTGHASSLCLCSNSATRRLVTATDRVSASDVNKTKFLTWRPRPIFWSQTGLVLRPTVSAHIAGVSIRVRLCKNYPTFSWITMHNLVVSHTVCAYVAIRTLRMELWAVMTPRNMLLFICASMPNSVILH